MYRADYNPDGVLWESEFTHAGRKYKRQDLEASTKIVYQGFIFCFWVIVLLQGCLPCVLTVLDYPFHCNSFKMEEVISWSAVIISLHLSQKTFPSLVLFTAMEIGWSAFHLRMRLGIWQLYIFFFFFFFFSPFVFFFPNHYFDFILCTIQHLSDLKF